MLSNCLFVDICCRIYSSIFKHFTLFGTFDFTAASRVCLKSRTDESVEMSYSIRVIVSYSYKKSNSVQTQ